MVEEIEEDQLVVDVDASSHCKGRTRVSYCDKEMLEMSKVWAFVA